MSAHSHNRRRRRGDHAHEEHADERWLLTYSDMITLLMALFIVMWSISSVNISKFHALSKSLKQAFAGQLTEGGDGVLQGGKQVLQPEGAQVRPTDITREDPSRVLDEKSAPHSSDLSGLVALKAQIDRYATQHGLENQIETQIDERGLVVRLLTDKVLFDPGRAVVKPAGIPLIAQVAVLIRRLRVGNPIRVEGNTDSTPIRTYQFPSNWELSTARATAVLQVLRGHGVPQKNLSAAGYADQRPVASNATESGRHLNRHVDIVVVRNPATEGAMP